MKKLRGFCLLFLALALLCCTGCAGSDYSSQFFAMDTVMNISAYGKNGETAVKACEKEINRLDSLLSVENENSEILALNRDKGLTPCEDTLEIISRSTEINAITNGAFDITTEPLTRAWGFYSGIENRVPEQSVIDKALKGVGSEHIRINKNSIELDSNASVDLGGIAKGYASSRTAEILKDNGVDSAIISLGGNVRALGAKPDGSNWSVAICDPDDNSENIGTVSVKDKAVVTSGGYQRYFEQDGKIYHHIIDPKTGAPADSGLKSVTVISDDDVLADALSTALFIMGLNSAEEFYHDNSALFDAVFITDDNEIYITEKLKGSFSSSLDFEVIKS